MSFRPASSAALSMRRERQQPRSETAIPTTTATQTVCPPESTPEDHLHLARLVRDLPDRDREICLLLGEGFNGREIAEHLAISPDAARQSICRIRRRLANERK